MDNIPPIYMYLHIPRTGGTTVENSVSNWDDRNNENYLKHYYYVQNWTEEFYDQKSIPRLNFRTTDQQKQLILMTGHSIFANSHRWLKVRRSPHIWATIRNPIERLLSSFNMRYTKQVLCQDPGAFSTQTPVMDEWAMRQQKVANDYDTLWEFYQDVTFETNMQCKWIIKNFLKHDGTTWSRHPIYVFGPDTGIPVEHAVPMTWPEWMFRPTEDMKNINWYELVANFFPEIWWLGTVERLDDELPEFCKFSGLEYNNNKHNHTNMKYWTMEDVMAQPDIAKLIEAEQYDFQLYEAAKNWKRPF